METATNKTVDFFRNQLGKEVFNSPSAFGNWLKPKAIKIDAGALICEYIVREEMTNPAKILHGGVIAGIIDDMIGATVFTLEKSNFFSTINNSIDYFAPSKIGDVITAQTRVVKMGREIINLECEIWNLKKNRLIARGTSNLMKTNLNV